jgi:hypothetical protein
VEGVSIDDKIATRLLQENGMTIRQGYLVFRNDSESLKKLVHGTKFESDLRGQLLRVQGAKRMDPMRFGSLGVARGVGVPIGTVVDDEPPI